MTESRRREDTLAEWSRLHGGYDPRGSVLVHGWLRLVFRLARPLATRSVTPSFVTATGVVSAAVACPLAGGGRWLRLAAAAAVALSALLDGVDGALAIESGRTTRVGFVADSVADRVADGLFLVALWLVGATAWVAVAAGAVTFLLEYTRARSAAAGMTEIGLVTVGERPTRVVVTVMALLASAVLASHAADVATGGVAALLAVGAIAFGQYVVTARRVLARIG